jgi:hypothetical protein
MMDFVLPPVVAVLVWWLGTGGVMLLDRLPRDSWRFTLGAATTVVAAALVCIARSADNTTTAGAYAGFVCAVVAWGWHELTFLAGWITGPRRSGCSEPSHWPTRLRESVQAILWHEIGILLMLGLIAVLTWNRANPVALWTFGLLWAMRLSAKVNLFLGRGGHRQRLRRPGRGRAAGRAAGYRVRCSSAGPAPGGRAYVHRTGRLHLRRRPDHRHRALPAGGAVAAAAGRRLADDVELRPVARSTACASTTASTSTTAATPPHARRGGAASRRATWPATRNSCAQREGASASASSSSATCPSTAQPTCSVAPDLMRCSGWRSVYSMAAAA